MQAICWILIIIFARFLQLDVLSSNYNSKCKDKHYNYTIDVKVL